MYAQRSSVADVGLPKKKKHRGNDRISSRLSRAYWPSYHYYTTAARLRDTVVCVPPFASSVDPLNSLWPLLLDLNGSYMKRELFCYHMGCRILQGPKSGICVENWPN